MQHFWDLQGAKNWTTKVYPLSAWGVRVRWMLALRRWRHLYLAHIEMSKFDISLIISISVTSTYWQTDLPSCFCSWKSNEQTKGRIHIYVLFWNLDIKKNRFYMKMYPVSLVDTFAHFQVCSRLYSPAHLLPSPHPVRVVSRKRFLQKFVYLAR